MPTKMSYLQSAFGCPFYKGDDGRREITCEGILPGSMNTIRFARRAQFAQWVALRCAADYQACPFCALAELKYQADSSGP